VVNTKNGIWDVTAYSPVAHYRCFRESCCLLLSRIWR